jgi:hypothetical protein
MKEQEDIAPRHFGAKVHLTGQAPGTGENNCAKGLGNFNGPVL